VRIEQNSPQCRALGVPTLKEYPRLPIAAFRANQEGWVVLEYDVENGQVVHLQVIASSPSGLFDQAVIDSVAKQLYASQLSAKSCRQEFVFKIE
jgi:TonB family protein